MDVVELDARGGGRVAELIAAIPSGAWERETPCGDWTVRLLVAHLVAGNVKYTDIARGSDFTPGAPDVALGDDAAATYRDTLAEMLQAWREPGALEREVGLPRGQRGRGELALWLHLAETLGHGWDLAVATGQPARFDDDVVMASLEECRRRMPAERGEGSPFADARYVDGPPIDELAAYLGRDVGARERR
jgi:uncharacterized protein (TIGR03086 family)